MNKITQIVIAVAALALLGVGVWWGMNEKNNNVAPEVNTNSQANLNSNSSNTNQVANANIPVNQNQNTNSGVPEGWTRYVDSEFGFTITIPKDWLVNSNSDLGLSIIPQGFSEQIYVLKVVEGDAEKGITWLNSHRGDGSGVTFSRTDEKFTLNSTDGYVYELGDNRYSVIPLGNLTVLVYLNVFEQQEPFKQYSQTYRTIIASFRK